MAITDTTLRLADCEPLTHYVRCTFENDDFPAHVSDVTFDHCVFDADQTRNDFINVTFTACDFANTDFTAASFGGCTFSDCRLLGADFTGVTLSQTRMQGCLAQLANFSEVSLRKCDFAACDFTDASFQSVTTRTKVAFPDCKLVNVDLYDTPLTKWDVSEADINGIRLDARHIAGMTIASWQAAALIQVFGVKVK